MEAVRNFFGGCCDSLTQMNCTQQARTHCLARGQNRKLRRIAIGLNGLLVISGLSVAIICLMLSQSHHIELVESAVGVVADVVEDDDVKAEGNSTFVPPKSGTRLWIRPFAIIAVSIAISLISTSMFGLVAVVGNRRWLLYLHAGILIGICVAQITATIVMLVHRQSILSNQLKLLGFLHKRANRPGSLVSRHVVYAIQKAFSCCGIETVESLDAFERVKCKAGKEGLGISKTILNVLSGGRSGAHEVVGCGPRISTFFYNHIATMAVFSFLFVFVQIACAAISIMIALVKGKRRRSSSV